MLGIRKGPDSFKDKTMILNLMKTIRECFRLFGLLKEIKCKECGDDNVYADPNMPDGTYVCRSCRDRLGVSESPPVAAKSGPGPFYLEDARYIIENLSDTSVHSPGFEQSFDELLEWFTSLNVDPTLVEGLKSEVTIMRTSGKKRSRWSARFGGSSSNEEALQEALYMLEIIYGGDPELEQYRSTND